MGAVSASGHQGASWETTYFRALSSPGSAPAHTADCARPTEARKTLGDLVDRARLAGEPRMVTHYSKAAAVVISADWFHLAAACMALQAAGGPARDPGAGYPC